LGLNDYFNCSQGQFYCGVGGLNSFGRELVNEHFSFCIELGLKISGINQEVAPGQWEFQIGPVTGIEAAHQLMIGRYVLEILAEKYEVYISYEPKLYEKLNGSGCHINFSTKSMRGEDVRNYNTEGINYIFAGIKKLEAKHAEHIAAYGKDNHLRLTGLHETSSMDKFSWGIGTRNTSIRIGNETYRNNCGYFEDRRPAANVDPYLSTALLFKTIVIDDKPDDDDLVPISFNWQQFAALMDNR
jgi:glutamine synthetase